MALPTSGYVPGHITYRVWYPHAIEHDVIRLEINIRAEKAMTADIADDIIRPHMEALLRDARAASGDPDLRLLRTYHGMRDEDVTPTPPPPAGPVA